MYSPSYGAKNQQVSRKQNLWFEMSSLRHILRQKPALFTMKPSDFRTLRACFAAFGCAVFFAC
ncbi:MAG: hypothetical protein U1E02_37380, partial [Hydrogenophaga sp.]|nr:hypothetical protein [Hydrogenophaga sp.]